MATFNTGHGKLGEFYGRAYQWTTKSGSHWTSGVGQSRSSGLQAGQAIEFNLDIDARLAAKGLHDIHFGNIIGRKDVVAVCRKAILKARNSIRKDTKSAIGNDPRAAWRGVKMVIYKKQAIGGNVSMLDTKGKVYTKPDTRTRKQNRHISAHTKQLNEYYGESRAFVLRFLNFGTKARYSDSRGRYNSGATRYYYTNTNAKLFRGKLTARNWFGESANKHMEKAADEIGEGVANLVVKRFNK